MENFNLDSFAAEEVTLDNATIGGEVTPTGEWISETTMHVKDFYDNQTQLIVNVLAKDLYYTAPSE